MPAPGSRRPREGLPAHARPAVAAGGVVGGVPVGVDLSWLPFAGVVSYALATAHFPQVVPGLPAAGYWAAGILAAVGQAGMVLAHEFGHITCARAFGVPTRRVTLFLFGGLAELDSEPPSPKADVLVALAGPAVSAVLAVACWGLWRAAVAAGWVDGGPVADGYAPGLLTAGLPADAGAPGLLRAGAVAVVGFWVLVNVAMAVFNLLPGFPLDGGRVVRGLAWWWTGSAKRATRLASAAGVAVGCGVVALGLWWAASGGGWAAAWPAAMGVALVAAARFSDARGRLRRTLAGVPARRVMTPRADLHVVPAAATLRQYYENALLGAGRATVPVEGPDGALLGTLSPRVLAAVPEADWATTPAADACEPVPDAGRILPGVDAVAALAWMQQAGRTRLFAVDGRGRLRGVLTAGDAARALRARVDLDADEPPQPPA